MKRTMFFWLASSLALPLWAQDGPSQTQGQTAGAAAAKGKGKAQAPPAAKPLSPEDAEIQRLQDERRRLLKQKEIEKLRKENEQLEGSAEKPAVVQAQAPPAKILSPEDAELQHLEEERKRLLKEQEIEKLRKQNDALKAPPQPSAPVLPPQPVQAAVPAANPCPPRAQQGPKVSVKAPPKASAWACQHLGVCADNRPAPQNDDSGCTAAPVNGQPAK